MSSLAERLAAARRQAEQAAQGDNAPGPDAAGTTGPGANGGDSDAAGQKDPGQSGGYAANADANSGGEAAEGRRRQTPKVADPTSRRRGGSTE
jgi:hypothetical protein